MFTPPYGFKQNKWKQKKKRNEAHKLWLGLEKRFSSSSAWAADEMDLNKMSKMVLTAMKIKQDADKMKDWSANKETEKLNFSTYSKKKIYVWLSSLLF